MRSSGFAGALPAATVTGGIVVAGRTVVTGFNVANGPTPLFNVVGGAGTVGNDDGTLPLLVPPAFTVVDVFDAVVVVVDDVGLVVADDLAVVALAVVALLTVVVDLLSFTVDAVVEVEAVFFAHDVNANPTSTVSPTARNPALIFIRCHYPSYDGAQRADPRP